jgi:thioredoxin reductase
LNIDITFDVIIVGGGPAGLSAAVVLGRCCRRVLVCDAGNPRNAKSRGVHGFLSREGILPGELLKVAREQAAGYGVSMTEGVVASVCADSGAFAVSLLDGKQFRARKVLLATGVVDRIPQIDGIEELYGKSVHHCPYCDGWEHKGQPIAVYGKGSGGVALALAMKTWSGDVVLCTDEARIRTQDKRRLAGQNIEVCQKKIGRLEGKDGDLIRILFEDGTSIPRRALFFSTGNVQRSQIPIDLGCSLNQKGAVQTTRVCATNVPGIYVAGDASFDAQFVAVAAAEGAKAGMAINVALQKEDQA